MKHLYTLLALTLLTLTAGCSSQKEFTVGYDNEVYRQRMAHFAEHPLSAHQVVFFGNSLTQGGDWQALFPTADVANRGISGDNTFGMLARIDEVVASQPSLFVMLAGINDISQDCPVEKIVANQREIVSRLKADSPNTRIIIESPLPINNDFGRYVRLNGKEQEVQKLRRALRVMAKQEGVMYLDIHPFFADASGKLRAELTRDGLHLTKDAYLLWANIIRRHIPSDK